MQIIVNHLTRMSADKVCVAGIAVDGGRHVRPIRRGPRWDREHLTENGGPFELGAVVDLGAVRLIGTAPELEDTLVAEREVTHHGRLRDEAFWDMVLSASHHELRRSFGDDLRRLPHDKAGVQPGTGTASLGMEVPRSDGRVGCG